MYAFSTPTTNSEIDATPRISRKDIFDLQLVRFILLVSKIRQEEEEVPSKKRYIVSEINRLNYEIKFKKMQRKVFTFDPYAIIDINLWVDLI